MSFSHTLKKNNNAFKKPLFYKGFVFLSFGKYDGKYPYIPMIAIYKKGSRVVIFKHNMLQIKVFCCFLCITQ